VTAVQLSLPSARVTDPDPSRAAALSVRPANGELVDCIHRAVQRYGPLSHEQIADAVCKSQPGRWLAATVVTACARAELVAWGTDVNGRGRTVTTWVTA
jgi:hypothetical protein